MNNEKSNINTTDERWGGYVPWFLRHQDFFGVGNFQTFFSRLSQRLERLFLYESGIQNMYHFVEWLESESLQRFRRKKAENFKKSIHEQIPWYFKPETIDLEVQHTWEVEKRAAISQDRSDLMLLKEMIEISRSQTTEDKDRFQFHYWKAVIERIAVLESLLRILPQNPWTQQLRQDVRKYFAEAQIMLDIHGNPPLIVPMEEPLLQNNVLDNLLPRLASQFPDRAKELIKVYHDSRTGVSPDSIFSEAFKTLEEIARSITGDKSFMFDAVHLNKHFPLLHQTIHETMKKLAGHRGDEGAHARSAPDPHEIRYLLFSVCNIALLLLDYPAAD